MTQHIGRKTCNTKHACFFQNRLCTGADKPNANPAQVHLPDLPGALFCHSDAAHPLHSISAHCGLANLHRQTWLHTVTKRIRHPTLRSRVPAETHTHIQYLWPSWRANPWPAPPCLSPACAYQGTAGKLVSAILQPPGSPRVVHLNNTTVAHTNYRPKHALEPDSCRSLAWPLRKSCNRYCSAFGSPMSLNIFRSVRKASQAEIPGNRGLPFSVLASIGPSICTGHVDADSLHQQLRTSRLPPGLFLRRFKHRTSSEPSSSKQHSPEPAMTGMASEGTLSRKA